MSVKYRNMWAYKTIINRLKTEVDTENKQQFLCKCVYYVVVFKQFCSLSMLTGKNKMCTGGSGNQGFYHLKTK